MIAGEREDSFVTKIQKHIDETQSNIIGWNYELDHAVCKEDKEHERYCKMMIKLWENTLIELENILHNL